MGTASISPREDFHRSITRPPGQINLALSCLYIAKERNPDLDVSAYLGRISEIAEQIRKPSRNRMSAYDRIYSISDLLFGKLGFKGNTGSYYDVRNSMLDEVLDRKLGIPITLSILYIEVGKRIGLELSGVNMASHFLLATGQGDARVYIDPFHGGRILSRRECLVMRLGSGGISHDSDEIERAESTYLPIADNRVILARVLGNIKFLYAQHNDMEGALAAAQRISVLIPWDWRNLGDIAQICARSGYARQTIDALNRMYQTMPPHEDNSLLVDALQSLKSMVESEGFVDPEKIHEIPFFRM